MRRRLAFAAMTVAAWGVVYNGAQLFVWLTQRAFDTSRPDFVNDFRLFYVGAVTGLRYGWSHLYDVNLQKSVLESVWPSPFAPFDNPPPLAWLVAPLTVLPVRDAYAFWMVLCVAWLLVTALVLAPPTRAWRFAFVLLVLGTLPAFLAISAGQVSPLVAAACVGAWWLLRRKHHVGAGLLLSVVLIKPQLALLVPLTLLTAGYVQASLAFGASAVVVSGLSLVSVGATGIHQYLTLIQPLSNDPYVLRWSLVSIVGDGWLWWVTALLCIGIALIAARMSGSTDPGVPIAVGIAASLLINHHMTPADLFMAVVPICMLLRTERSAPWLALLAGAWLAVWLSVIIPIALLAATLGLLLAIAAAEFRAQFGRRGQIESLEGARPAG